MGGGFQQKSIPSIILRGDWLKAWGFHAGDAERIIQVMRDEIRAEAENE